MPKGWKLSAPPTERFSNFLYEGRNGKNTSTLRKNNNYLNLIKKLKAPFNDFCLLIGLAYLLHTSKTPISTIPKPLYINQTSIISTYILSFQNLPL